MSPNALTTLRHQSAGPGALIAVIFLGALTSEPAIAEERIGKSQQPLVIGSGTTLWTNYNNHIPMCWHETLQFPNKAAADKAKGFVYQTIHDGWLSLLNLTASWTECPSTGTAKHVRVKLRIGDANANGTTKTTGMDTLSTPQERIPAPPDDAPGLLMGFPSNWDQDAGTRATFRSLILHEFGHILGFTHEGQRNDGPAGVDCYERGSGFKGVLIGAADPTSIMGWSYCREALGALSPMDVAAARAVYGAGRSGTNDFNGDGRSDILWYNASTGETQQWLMSTGSRIGRRTVSDGSKPTLIGPPWRIVGSRDFDLDGRSDILWHNASSGETQLWYLRDFVLSGRATVTDESGRPILVGEPWRIVGTNDFNRDGRTDILWHNSTSSETQIWHMQGSRILGRATVHDEKGSPIFVGGPWSIVGTGDFNRDGRADILWHDSGRHDGQIWYMNGFRIIGRENLRGENGNPIPVGPPWRITGANDFNQDGYPDISWHNSSTGETQIWFMTGAAIRLRHTVDAVFDGGGALVGPPWHIMNH